MGAAVGWGALAASSLVIGALLGLARTWPALVVGLVLGFGAGALVSAVSFELVEEGAQVGGPGVLALGLATGALRTSGPIRSSSAAMRRPPGRARGPALALGAFLDGIPEQLVLGIGLAAGEGVSVGLLAAIFVSNLPEAVGSATEMRAGGTPPARCCGCGWRSRSCARSPRPPATRWGTSTGGDLRAFVNGFAAGALLVMLIDSMIPDGRKSRPRRRARHRARLRRRRRALRRVMSARVSPPSAQVSLGYYPPDTRS